MRLSSCFYGARSRGRTGIPCGERDFKWFCATCTKPVSLYGIKRKERQKRQFCRPDGRKMHTGLAPRTPASLATIAQAMRSRGCGYTDMAESGKRGPSR